MKHLIIAVAIAALAAGSAPAANILANSGFETGNLAPWTDSNDYCGGCTWSVDNSDAHSGDFSAWISGNRLLEQTFAAIPVADISEVSFWMRHPDGGSAVAAFFAYSDSSSQEVLLSTDGNWNFFNITSSLAAGKSLTGFGVYGNSGALARFDDAVVNTASGVPEPGTWMLLSFGVGAIGLRKRWSR
jgi:hypothetical protein